MAATNCTQTVLGIERPRPVLRLWADMERDMASLHARSPADVPSPVRPPASPQSISKRLKREHTIQNRLTDDTVGRAQKRPKASEKVDCEAVGDSTIEFERAVTVEEAIRIRFEHAQRTGSVIEAI